MISKEKIFAGLSPYAKKYIDEEHIFIYDTIDSTNTPAREYAATAPTLPALFLAERQTAGRGRLGRSFDSEPGGIYMTLVIPSPDYTPAELTVAAGVAVADAIEAMTTLAPKIKWVNDVLLGEKKVAGILALGEFSEGGKLQHALLGIGINAAERPFPPDISNIATSIERECGYAPDRDMLTADVISALLSALADRSRTIRRYRERSLVIGKKIAFTYGAALCEGLALDIDDDGSLRVKLDSEEVISLGFGEISIKPIV